MTAILKKISRALFYTAIFSGILFSSTSFSDVRNFTILNGDVTTSWKEDLTSSVLEIQAGNFTVIKYPNLTIEKSEKIRLIQPNEDAITFIWVENGPISFEGNLEGNGKIFLINSEGLTFGDNASLSSDGEIVCCAYFPLHENFWKENPMFFTHPGRDRGTYTISFSPKTEIGLDSKTGIFSKKSNVSMLLADALKQASDSKHFTIDAKEIIITENGHDKNIPSLDNITILSSSNIPLLEGNTTLSTPLSEANNHSLPTLADENSIESEYIEERSILKIFLPQSTLTAPAQ